MKAWKALLPPLIGIGIALLPAPAGLAPYAWHYFALFAAVVVALVLEPLPGGAVGLLGLTVAVILARYVLFSPEQLAKPGFTSLIIGPGGVRDLVSAVVFGASHVDGVEINPIIANDVMRGQFLDYSGGIYEHPRVRISIDDGRSFVHRSRDHYDVI